jgi:thymidylate synthase (FAD)
VHHQDVTVHLIARPQLVDAGVKEWLATMGPSALDWWTRNGYGDTADAELLVELAGRRCYRSFATDLNPNLTRIREDHDAYMANLLGQRHGSVLEHAYFVFGIEGVSRVLTHELVRHRVGTSISQESGRYVRLTDIPFRLPGWVDGDSVLREKAHELLWLSEQFQALAAQRTGIDDPGTSFHYKKLVTSDMRRFAPEGRLNGLEWGANLRTLRLLVELRTAHGAEEEIRKLFCKIAELMVHEAPAVFGDFEQQGDGSWLPTNSRV